VTYENEAFLMNQPLPWDVRSGKEKLASKKFEKDVENASRRLQYFP